MPDRIASDEATSLETLAEQLILELALDIAEREPGEETPKTELNDLGFDSVAYHGLAGLMSEEYGIDIKPTVFFNVHTPRNLAIHLITHHREAVLARHRNNLSETKIEAASPRATLAAPAVVEFALKAQDDPIAIVGVAANMPQSPDAGTLWRNLVSARDLIGEIPSERWNWRELPDSAGLRWGGFIADADCFDAAFFSISPTEARQMDPQQRLFLQTAWHALENAGISPARLAGTNAGVFVGVGSVDYGHVTTQLDGHTATGGSHALMANRLSYFLDLRGPSESMDTACSSSLVAVHRAVGAIRAGECDLAVVGGANLMLTPALYVALSRAGMLSPAGRCKTFGAAADGYVRGEGIGAVVLKPLSKAVADGNPIYALVRGTAVNHGGRATSLTAPNAAAQTELIVRAWRQAAIDPSTASYIEAHGTGTALGDPVEVEALTEAFRTLYQDRSLAPPQVPHCGLGSVKTNIGHLEAAAGIAGVIKVVMAMHHGTLPASLHCPEINPLISLEGGPFFVVRETKQWRPLHERDGRLAPYRAGVSSFGFGGSNAHIVLESYLATSTPERPSQPTAEDVFLLSARNDERLAVYAAKMAAWLGDSHPPFEDVCHTSRQGRDAMKCRLALVATDLEDLRTTLTAFSEGKLDTDPLAVFDAAQKTARGEALRMLGRRWRDGETIDWSPLSDVTARLIPLPGYPFAVSRYWCDEAPRLDRRFAHVDASVAPTPETGDGLALVDKIAAICRAILGHETIDAEASLAELGADSILAARIQGSIAHTLGVSLPLGAMIKADTINKIAAMIEARASVPAIVDRQQDSNLPLVPEDGAAALVRRVPGDDPVSAAQTQFIFLDHASPCNPAFNLPGALRIDGPFSVEAARQGFQRLLAGHEVLRARFALQAGEPRMRIEAETKVPFECVDLAPLLPSEKEQRIVELIQQSQSKPFDLCNGPLCRVLILELGDEDHILLLVVHHIAADIASAAILLGEIGRAGQGKQEQPGALSYADYAAWERTHLPATIERELPFWRAKLADLPVELPLPFDRPRPARVSYRGGVIRFAFDAEAMKALTDFARGQHTSPFVVLIAAFKIMLMHFADHGDIAVGSPYANRSLVGTADMVGCLAYALILRTKIEKDQSFAEVIANVGQTVHEAFDHLYVPYTRLVEELRPERRPGVNPLFQTLFNVIPITALPEEWAAFDVEPEFTDYDLSLRIYLGRSGARGSLQYSTDLFDAETAEAIGSFYRDLVGVLVTMPEILVGEVTLPEHLADRKAAAVARPAPRELRIASTFTDRPIAEGLHYLGDLSGAPIVPKFAGYNRLFQELYDPKGLLFSPGGHNLVMTRTQDWLRYCKAESVPERVALASRRFDELAEALEQATKRLNTPTLVVITPSEPTRTGIGVQQEAALRRRFLERLAALPTLTVEDCQEIVHDATTIFDLTADDQGHVPYTREFFAALAAHVVQWLEPKNRNHSLSGSELVEAIDQQARTSAQKVRAPYAAPENEAQERIIAAFAATVGLDNIGLDDDFFALGGHSLAALRMISRLNVELNFQFSIADIFLSPTPRALASRASGEGTVETYVELAEAATLPDDIQPLSVAPAARPERILLTGATGFVGRFLLREFLDQGAHRVLCLQRCADPKTGFERLRQTLKRWSLWRPGDEDRIEILPGDLSAPRLGLSEADYRRACDEPDAICHNATSMNHLETFESARKANVEGVTEVLRIAVHGRPKTVNYVSTLAVFSAIGHEGMRQVDETTPIDLERHLFANGYTTSKWVGEQLIHLAAQRGLPCNVYRLGLITGDAELGRYDELQSFHRLLESCIRIGAGFEKFKYDLVITPVDYVARAMVRLGNDHSRGGGVFHLSSMTVTPMEAVFALYNQVAEPPLAILSHRAWLDRIRDRFEAGETLPIMPLVHSILNMDDRTLQAFAAERERVTLRFDCSRTRSELEQAGVVMPPFNADLMGIYLRGMLVANPKLNFLLKDRSMTPEFA